MLHQEPVIYYNIMGPLWSFHNNLLKFMVPCWAVILKFLGSLCDQKPCGTVMKCEIRCWGACGEVCVYVYMNNKVCEPNRSKVYYIVVTYMLDV